MRTGLTGAALVGLVTTASAPSGAALANRVSVAAPGSNPVDAGAGARAPAAPPANVVEVVPPAPDDRPVEDAQVQNDPPPASRSSGVANMGVPILAGVALLLASVGGIAALLLSRQVARLDGRVAALERRKRSTPQGESAPPPQLALQPSDPEKTVARTGAKGRASPADRMSEASAPRARRDPAPQASTSSSDQLDRLQAEVADLIDRPGLRSSDYDAAVRQYGDIVGIEIAADGSSARLVEGSSDPKQRLIAVRLADGSTVAILPSSRFVKEFPMTYKETLEAGVDVKNCYDCRIDGSATLKLFRIASAGVNAGDQVHDVQPGVLTGFVR